MIKYCQRCFYHENHPLGIVIGEDGVCSGCKTHDEKFEIDWAERKEQLRNILESYRSKNRKFHDCVVPVSGAKDSYFIVHTLVKEFGLNPLLVNYNKHYNTQMGIRNLAYLRTLFDCDFESLVVAPEKVKRITKVTLKNFASMYWHCLAGETAFPVQVAVKHRIPLVVWGAHQGLDQVGMFSHLDSVEMTRRYRKNHDLMGYEAEDLLALNEGLTEDDVLPFVYPDENEISTVGVRGIYLGNYFPWDSKIQHDHMVKEYNYQTGCQGNTFDIYNHVDCFHYSYLHDVIKLLKQGYGKATDHAVRELRWGRVSRAEAFSLIQKYTKLNLGPDTDVFCDWLGIRKGELEEILEEFANKRFWHGHKGEYQPTQENLLAQDFGQGQKCDYEKTFILNQQNCPPERSSYTLIGKGYVLNHNHYVGV